MRISDWSSDVCSSDLIADAEPLEVALEFGRIKGRDIPSRPALRRRRFLHLVVAGVGVRGQVADVGDVDDMAQLVTLERQGTAQRVGEDIGAHVADMLLIIDGRSAAIDALLVRVDGHERYELARLAVVETRRRGCLHCTKGN